jgi:hypothetical protein
LSYKQEAAGSSPASPITRGRSSAVVERSSETRRGAGSSPAGHTPWLRSSTRQSCRLLIGGLQVRLLPGPPLEGLPLARYPVSKTGAASAVGGSTPSPSALLSPTQSGVVERSDARLLLASRRFESCRRSSTSKRRSVSVAARLADDEQGLVRFQDLRLIHMPPWSSGSDAGFSARRRGFESRRGFSSGCGGDGHPAGFGNRRPLVRLQPARPCTKRGRGAAVLASLMSSRPWVRIPPAQLLGGVAQRPEHSLVRRLAAGSIPVVPARGGCGVTAAFEVVILAVPVRVRSAAPRTRTLSIGELSGL